MKKWMLKSKFIVIGVILGGIGGYAYYHFVGCASGTCMISSKPLNSTLYFGLMGGLFMSIFNNKSNGNTKQT
jgi:phage shock protein E